MKKTWLTLNFALVITALNTSVTVERKLFFFLQPQLTCYHGNIWAATLTVKLVIKINFGMTVNGTILTMGIVPLSKVCAQLSPERKKIIDDSSP